MLPVVVIKRDPDEKTEVHLFGLPEGTDVIELDLGAGFDAGHLDSGDQPAVKEFCEAVREEIADLPEDHPARVLVEKELVELESNFADEVPE
jgi:hypothetical protein